MAISTLPAAPSRNEPATFADKSDALLGALATFVTEANALQTDVNTKQGTASTAATTATTKAAEALASADAAALSETAAELAATEATTLTESYQGSLASDPTLDKNGNALAAGDWYVNSSTSYIKVYTGSAWVQGISSVSGVTSLNGSTGVLTGFVTETGSVTLTNKTLTAPKYTRDNDGTISGGTWAIDYANGPLIKATVGAAITTITLSNLPASGTVGHLKLMLVNPGAYAITFPAAWLFIKSDFTTTNFAGLGVTLPASGVVLFDLITDDAGTNIYVTISRN